MSIALAGTLSSAQNWGRKLTGGVRELQVVEERM